MTQTRTRPDLGDSALRAAVDGLPRVHLAFLPTPLERLDRLSERLGISLWIKRDDQTGLVLGGNKARKLEFLLGDALAHNADTVITTGGSQSNHARITAGACRKLGLDCHLVLDRGRHPKNGNLLLDHLLGAKVHLIEEPDPLVAAEAMKVLAGDLKDSGKSPYVIPRGGSVPQGAVGYAAMVAELAGQMTEQSVVPDCVYLATGSCGTHSGVMAGRALMQAKWVVQGISVSRSTSLQETKVLGLGNELLEWLRQEMRVEPGDVHVDDGFVGEGYGVPTGAVWKALELLAREEAMLLDPVYTGKAMSGLLQHIRDGKIEPGATVIFVHTGGAPALFGYAGEAEAHINS